MGTTTGGVRVRKTLRLWLTAGFLVACARPPRADAALLVFAAPSLGPTLEGVRRLFEAAHPGMEVRIELAASRISCAKVAEQGREADVVLSADAELIDELLLPEHAAFDVHFAGNALVIAYHEASPVGAMLGTRVPWQLALSRPGVRVGVANPAAAPVGYRALEALRRNDALAAPALRQGARIGAALREADQRPDVAKLLAPLQVGDIDAAFVYRSDARLHHLPYVLLDPRLDGSADASYGLTIPLAAPHPEAARAFVEILLSPAGEAIGRAHQLPLWPPERRLAHGAPPPWLGGVSGAQG
jgi:ABC-type molybdate transport system substrate-binding protein